MAKTYFSISATLLVLASSAYAFPLSTYRRQIDGPTQEAAAATRFSQLREKLGFANAKLSDPRGLFASALRADNGTKDLSSLLFNQLFWGVSTELRREAAFGTPITFDPSWGMDQARAAKTNARDAFCTAKLANELTKLLDPALSYLTRQSARLTSEAAGSAPASEIDRQRVALIAAYIRDSQPKIERVETIEQRLGTVANTEVVDGKLHRLIFNVGKGETFPLSLSMLLNFRTQRSEAFVAVLDCFTNHLQKIADDKKADSKLREKAKIVLSMGSSKLEGAKNVHRRLTRLLIEDKNGKMDTRRIDFLLDLMLQARGEDIPADGEFGISEPKQATAKTLGDVFFASLPALKAGATAPPPRVAVERDYLYYTQLNDQLFELKNRLAEDAIKAKAVEDYVKAMP